MLSASQRRRLQRPTPLRFHPLPVPVMMDLYNTLCNFLPAGSITLPVSSPFSGAAVPAEDGWIQFNPTSDLDAPAVQDAPAILESIRFLVRHRFIAATYSAQEEQGQLFVRIYLIPWDLPGSKGELRGRDEDTILRPGRRRLKDLFLRIRQDSSLWTSDASSPSIPQLFWENRIVCLLGSFSL